MSEINLSWLTQLPTFSYLPQENPSIASTLIKPFSLFSLFRSNSAIPPTKLLNALHVLAATPAVEGQLCLSPAAATKALLDFHAYMLRIHEAASDQRNHATLAERLDEIVHAYSAAFYIAALAAVSPHQPHLIALRQIAQDTLRAIFILRDHLSPEAHPQICEALDAQILAAPFPPRSTYYHLTPLFTIIRNMVERLSFATRILTKPKGDTLGSVTEEDAVWVYDLVRSAVGELKGLGGIGPEGRTKAEKHDALRRARRMAMELDIWRAELAFAMTNASMGAVKARAGALHEPGVAAAQEEGEDVAIEKGDQEDVKPSLNPEDDEISIPDSPSPVKLELEAAVPEIKIEWEELTEDVLVLLLKDARTLVEDGHSSVLSDHISRGDWLGHLPEEIPLPSTPTKRTNSVSGESSADADEDDSDLDETSSKSSSEESVGESYSCPLRSILSLYDRFEEQRLAVWTSLPQSANAHKGRRKEMEAYMRGTDGLAGEAGEELGLVLLIEYDRQALVNYGLSYDKLDKWLELASNRNAKKIKRRKAAAQPTRARGGAKKVGGHRKTGSIASLGGLDVPAARTRGRSKTPAALSGAGSSRGATPKRGRGGRRSDA